jgi:hypothetical protein
VLGGGNNNGRQPRAAVGAEVVGVGVPALLLWGDGEWAELDEDVPTFRVYKSRVPSAVRYVNPERFNQLVLIAELIG